MKVWITNTLEFRNKDSLNILIEKLPNEFKPRAKKYKSISSAVNYCFGRILLQDALEELGYQQNKILELKYSENNKPYFEDNIQFSISHSNEFVAIAFDKNIKLGLDIEFIKPVDLKNFNAWFRMDEWKDIYNQDIPENKFFEYWVRKEAVLKAEDLSIGKLQEIYFHEFKTANTGLNTQNWILKEFYFHEKYKSVLALEKEINFEIIFKY